jgi:hypothetical protein
MKHLTGARMAASTPSKEKWVSLFALLPVSVKPARIKRKWLRIEHLVQMNISDIIRHECAFVDSLVTDMNVIGKVAAKKGTVVDNAESLADDALCDRHFVLPCGYWDRRETSADWLGRGRIGVGSYEISNFDNGFVFPHTIGAEIKKNPAGCIVLD